MATSTKAKAPAKTRRKKTTEAVTAAFNPYSGIDGVLDSIEKVEGLSTTSVDASEDRMSTSNLVMDLMLAGGIVGGGWYTNFGPEQSSKSTGAVVALAGAVLENVPIILYFDYEGSGVVDYTERIMRMQGVRLDYTDLFGVIDNKGTVVKRGRIRKYEEAVAEKFFNSVSRLLRSLPDKKRIGDTWYLVYDDTKENRALVKDRYDKAYLQKTKRLRIECSDGSPQAVIFVDSYPAMLPEDMDGDEVSNAMAQQARMFSEQIKRVKGRMRRKRVSVIGINQVRQKPAARFSNPEYEPCFIGSTPVHLADGTVDTIRNIVLERRDVEVLSFNKETGEVSAKRIIDWKDNGDKLVSDLVRVVYRAYDKFGKPSLAEFTSTKDHKIWTPHGWAKAGDLSSGDTVFINVPTDDKQQSLLGSYALDPHDPVVFRMHPVEVVETGLPDIRSEYERVYDLTIEDNHTYFVGGSDCAVGDTQDRFVRADGVAVSNCGDALKFYSDVRLRYNSRSLSGVPFTKGSGQLEEEPSVFGKGTDTYRYIHVRAHKNKLSTPGLEGWLRIWVKDRKGKAWGYCPVWDTFMYLVNTGQLTSDSKSTRKKLMLTLKVLTKSGEVKARDPVSLDWMLLKEWVLGTSDMIRSVCEALHIEKPFRLRDRCFRQMKQRMPDGQLFGLYMFYNHAYSDSGPEAGPEDKDPSDGDENDAD